MKNKAFHTIEIYLKSSSKPVKRGTIDITNTNITVEVSSGDNLLIKP